MKSLPSAGKALSVIFAVIWIVGCASTDSGQQSAEEAAAARAAEAAASEQAAAEAAAAKAAKEAMASLESVFYFDFDQSVLTAQTRADLDAQIAYLKSSTGSIRIEGHADERGTREYNMALGERRAKAISSYMVGNGIPSYRLDIVSYGEERPASYGSGESAWAKNRRVEIK
jgi:peptidoglycan-associated lipoprotein